MAYSFSWGVLKRFFFPDDDDSKDGEKAPSFYSLSTADRYLDADDPAILGGAEYLGLLASRSGAIIYDRMGREDSTVGGLLNLFRGPALSATWTIECDDEEIRQFVARNLGLMPVVHGCECSHVNWSKFLREVLGFLQFGFSLFEKTFELRDDGRMWIDQLAWRPQVSIESFETKGGHLDGVRQIVKFDPQPVIKSLGRDRLAYYGIAIGENWWGTSILRNAYRNWYIKSRLELIDAAAHQRFGLGVPVATYGENVSAEDLNTLEDLLKKLTSQRKSFLLLPKDDIDFEFKGMPSSQRESPLESMRYHDIEVAKSLGALFFNLGTTTSGSRAVVGTFSDVFFNALGSYLDLVVDHTNEDIIAPLVAMNFGDMASPASLAWSNLDNSQLEATARALSNLVGVDLIRPDDQTEDVLRGEFQLPPYSGPARSADDDGMDEA